MTLTNLSPWTRVQVTEEAVAEARAFAAPRLPQEAVGLMLPLPHGGAWVTELPNSSDEPEDTATLASGAILEGVERWFDHLAAENLPVPPKPGEVEIVVWHTHPSGHVGPSRVDMQQRRNYPAIACLVIPMPDGPVTRY